MAEQNFANHRRTFPLFHLFVMPVMVINFFWTIYRWWKTGFSLGGFESVLLAAGLVGGFLAARMMALTVQNRVIRLEERLRYERVLPTDLKARIPELTVAQVVSLRFASDAELPTLARKVLDDKMTERKAIKQMVKSWRPDFLRA
jgi:Family of unknown function (DUF6526)